MDTLESLHRLRCYSASLLSCFWESDVITKQQSTADEATPVTEASPIDRGRYLITIGSCNDCHTDGYMAAEGNVPENAWLLGSPIGWRGPWGTTYASNLRLTVQDQTEDAWVTIMKTRKALPPMPWANVNKMTESDARAIYQYVRSLGPAGERMPAAVPPDQEPTTPYISLMPIGPAGH